MKKLITLIIALAMAFVMALPAFAADNKTIYLPEKMSWMTAGTEARNYCDFPTVRCHSVYPESGLDLFSTIRCRLKRLCCDQRHSPLERTQPRLYYDYTQGRL